MTEITQPTTVRIAPTAVYFGDVELTSIACVAADGVKVIPGGKDDFNRVVIEFVVADVYVDDTLAVADPHPPEIKINPYADLKCPGLKPPRGWFGRSYLCEREYRHTGEHECAGVSW